MATCKDCLHYEVCAANEYVFSQFTDEIFERLIYIGNRIDCKRFKDKSRYIELPCEFMQKCFVIPTIENRLNEITEMKCIGFAFTNDSPNANLITDKNELYQPCFGAFGKTVFLTREEAEIALKESEQE